LRVRKEIEEREKRSLSTAFRLKDGLSVSSAWLSLDNVLEIVGAAIRCARKP
jgi:hypothetical protein